MIEVLALLAEHKLAWLLRSLSASKLPQCNYRQHRMAIGRRMRLLSFNFPLQGVLQAGRHFVSPNTMSADDTVPTT